MEGISVKNVTLISFSLLLLSPFCFNLAASSTPPMSDSTQDDACPIFCGQGTCKPSNASQGGGCECFPGWKTDPVFHACTLPNCTVDLTCGSGSLPPPLPGPFPLLPNRTDPCLLVWCADGTCMANGTGHICKCYEGSANLFGVPGFICLKECALGADCHGLSTSPGTQTGPPPPTSSSPGKELRPWGSTEAPNCSRSLQTLSTIMLAVLFIIWI